MQRIEPRPTEQHASAGASYYDDDESTRSDATTVNGARGDTPQSQDAKRSQKPELKPWSAGLPAGLQNTGRDAHVQTFEEIYGVPENFLEISVGEQEWVEHPADGSKPHFVYPISLETNIPAFKLRRSLVRRRYREFEVLHDVLERESSRVHIPPLPPKRWWDTNAKFLKDRQAGLNQFLSVVVKHPLLQTGSRILGAFLQDPHWNARDWS